MLCFRAMVVICRNGLFLAIIYCTTVLKVLSGYIMRNLLIAFVLIFSSAIVAQVRMGIPDIQYFDRHQYGGGTQNWKIAQAPNGLIYFANNEGVLEYDGSGWRKYQPAGSRNYRSVLCEGNKLYVGGFNSLGFSVQGKSIEHGYKDLTVPMLSDTLEDFWNIHHTPTGEVFHSHKGMVVVQNDSIVAVVGSESRLINSFYIHGRVLIHVDKQGLVELREQQLFPVRGGDLFKDMYISAILPLGPERLLICTVSHGLFVWDKETFVPFHSPVNELAKQVNVFCGVSYRDDLLVLGTIQRGVVICNLQGEVVLVVDKNKGLRNNTVLSLMVDREGVIWAGLDNGIAKINFQSGITFLQGYYDFGTGYCMLKFEQNYLLGTNQGLYTIGLDEMRNPEKNSTHFRRVSGSEGQVWCIQEVDGQVLVGHNMGAFQYSPQGELKKITAPDVYGVWLFRKYSERYLIAGTYTGLILFEKQNGSWVYAGRIAGFTESSRFFEIEADGSICISHGNKGLYQIFLSENLTNVTKVLKYTEFSNDVGEGIGVIRLFNQILFCTAKGIYFMDHGKAQFLKYDKFNALFASGFYPRLMKSDGHQNVWYFGDNELGVLRRQEDGSYKNISAPFLSIQGKLVNHFEFIYPIDENSVFVGIEDGFAHYNANSQLHHDDAAKFEVLYRSFYSLSDSVDHLEDVVNNEFNGATFSYSQNSFFVSFSAIFNSLNGVKYSTYLKGLDVDFLPWSARSYRELARLKEGHYVLWVKAMNGYGEVTKPVALSFTVNSPFLRSTLAYVIYVIVFVLVIFFLWFIGKKRIQNMKLEEERSQQKRFEQEREVLQRDALEAEGELIRVKNEKLVSEIDHREKELANTALHLLKKNEFLLLVKESLRKIKNDNRPEEFNRRMNVLIQKIDKDIEGENQWVVFETHFEEVHRTFLVQMQQKYPDLTQRELRLCAFIRMGMSSKEIAALMNITTHAVENSRSRLRTRLLLHNGENLQEYIQSI